MKKPKMTLLNAILFPICCAILFLVGQQNSFSMDTGNYDLQECKRAIKRIKSTTGVKNPLLNMCEFALKQPDFSSVIDEEGAIVMFNEKGSPIYGQTSRLIDYSTRGVYPARRLPSSELNNCKGKLISYHKELQRERRSTFKTIVIFSNSIKRLSVKL